MLADSRIPEEVAALQQRLLPEIIRHAAANVPFYQQAFRSLGLEPGDIRGVGDLRKLPLISRGDLADHPDAFHGSNYDLAQCTAFPSSGSTGQQVTVHYDDDALRFLDELQRRGFIGMFWRRHGPGRVLGPGRHRRVAIVSPGGGMHVHLRSSAASAGIPCLSILDPVEKNIDEMERLQPEVIFTFSSYLEVLLYNLPDGKLQCIRPKAVIFTASELKPNVRSTLEALWGCEFFGLYATSENQMVGYECVDHSGYHMFDPICPFMVLDDQGREANVGESGELVISNLYNKATVLLNYRQGDVASRAHACPCGCPLPKIGYLEGRVSDSIILPDGRVVTMRSLTPVFHKERGVRQFQVIQEARDRLLILVSMAQPDAREATRRIMERIRDTLPPGITVCVEKVDRIQPDPRTGKIRQLVPLREG